MYISAAVHSHPFGALQHEGVTTCKRLHTCATTYRAARDQGTWPLSALATLTDGLMCAPLQEWRGHETSMAYWCVSGKNAQDETQCSARSALKHTNGPGGACAPGKCREEHWQRRRQRGEIAQCSEWRAIPACTLRAFNAQFHNHVLGTTRRNKFFASQRNRGGLN